MTQQTREAQALEPLAVRKGEGEARWWFGALAEIKATAADTGGLMSIVEVTEPPGRRRSTSIIATTRASGSSRATSSSRSARRPSRRARATTSLGLATSPSFTVGDRGCRMLFVLVPGGFEELIRATSEPAPSHSRLRHRRSRPPRRSSG